MSRRSSASRRAALIALVSTVLPVTAANAAPVTRAASFFCTWGEGRGASGTAAVTAPFAAPEQRGTAPLSVVVTDDASRLHEFGIAAVQGSATLTVQTTADGITTSRVLTVPVPRTATVNGAPTALDLGAAVPAPSAVQGPVTVRLESFTLDLRAYDEDGFPMRVPDRALADVITRAPVVQPANPTAFRVPCSSDDGLAPRLVATFLAGDAPFVPLTAPTAVSFERGHDAVALDWSKPAGTFPISGYSIEVIKADGPFSGESTYAGAPADAAGTVIAASNAVRIIITAVDVNGARVGVLDTNKQTLLRTQPSPVTQTMTATATVNVPSIAKKPFTLTGTANLTATNSEFAVTGALDFQPALTRLTVKNSQLPISSKVALVRGGDVTGTFSNGLLKLTENVRLKVLDARAFGAIPIDLGNACQTKAYSTLKLTSGDPAPLATPTDQLLGYRGTFSAYRGTVSSPMAVSDLNGCEAIAGSFDPRAAGPGDISVSLAPAPITSAATSAG